MKHFNQNKIVSVSVGLTAIAIMVVGFSADASTTFAKYVGRCANNLAFYERHTSWCEAAYRIAPRMARHARAAAQERTYEPEATGQRVTVSRDHQAADDGHGEKFIALQTAQDVTAAPFFGLALGWFPGVLNLGTNTVAAPQIQQARAERQRVVTTYYVKKVVATNQ